MTTNELTGAETRTPLLEVILQVQFDPSENFSPEALQDSLFEPDTIVFTSEGFELRSRQKLSYGRLREIWAKLLPQALNRLGIASLNGVCLAYLNEIPLQDLRNFQTYLNVNIDMPTPLKDRIEFFRTEFRYKYDFGEICVWLQPDWDDELDGYCIQLHMESRHSGPLPVEELTSTIDQMHSGLKDVFRQILSEDYVRQLPQ